MASNSKCFWFRNRVSQEHLKLSTWLSYPWIPTENLSCCLGQPVPPYEGEEVMVKVSNWLYQSHPQKGFHPPKLGHQPNLGHVPRNQNSKMGHQTNLLKLNLSHPLRIFQNHKPQNRLDPTMLFQSKHRWPFKKLS